MKNPEFQAKVAQQLKSTDYASHCAMNLILKTDKRQHAQDLARFHADKARQLYSEAVAAVQSKSFHEKLEAH